MKSNRNPKTKRCAPVESDFLVSKICDVLYTKWQILKSQTNKQLKDCWQVFSADKKFDKIMNFRAVLWLKLPSLFAILLTNTDMASIEEAQLLCAPSSHVPTDTCDMNMTKWTISMKPILPANTDQLQCENYCIFNYLSPHIYLFSRYSCIYFVYKPNGLSQG